MQGFNTNLLGGKGGNTPGHPSLHKDFQASQSYIVSLWFKGKEKKENDHESEVFCPYLRLISKLCVTDNMPDSTYTFVNSKSVFLLEGL